MVAWQCATDAQQQLWQTQAASLLRLRKRKMHGPAERAFQENVLRVVDIACEKLAWQITAGVRQQAAECLLETAATGGTTACSGEAHDFSEQFQDHLKVIGEDAAFINDVRSLQKNPAAAAQLAGAWFDNYCEEHGIVTPLRDEVVLLLRCPKRRGR